MSTPASALRSTVLRVAISTAVAAGFTGALSLVGGCADVITYANDSRKEGIKRYNDGQYPEAAGSFRNAIRQDPTDYQSQYWLGLSYEAMKDNHLAIDAYKTSLRLMPTAGHAHYDPAFHDQVLDRLAQVIATSDVSHTETDLLQKTASDRKDAEQYRLLGRIARYRGDADSALQNYRTAVSINPKDFETTKELGLYLEQLSQTQEAGQVLKHAYRLEPSDDQVAAALRRLGMVPGPGLLDRDQLAEPIIPKGPLPDLANTGPKTQTSEAPRD